MCNSSLPLTVGHSTYYPEVGGDRMGSSHTRCGRRFAVLEWEHEGYGRLVVCMFCISKALEELGYDVIIENVPGRWAQAGSQWRMVRSRKKRRRGHK